MRPEEDIRRNYLTLQKMFHEVVSTADALLGIQPSRTSAELVPIVGEIRVHSLAGQQIILKRVYDTSIGPTHMEIAIGHTGENFDPVLTFTGSNVESFGVVLKGQDWPEFAQVRLAIIEFLKCAGTKENC